MIEPYDYIVVSSYDRAQTLCEKTLAYLAKCANAGQLTMAKVVVMVPGAEQGAIYASALAEYPEYSDVTLRTDAPLGLRDARNFLHGMFEHGTRVISFDDDIRKVEEKVGSRLSELVRYRKFARQAFRACRLSGARTWGVYPVRNAFFMKLNVTSDLRLILGGMYGFISEGGRAPLIEAPSKTDYAWTLANWRKHGAVVRFNDVCLDTKVYSGAGGVSFERTGDLEERSIRILERKYPGLVARKTGTKTGYPEMRLVCPKVKK